MTLVHQYPSYNYKQTVERLPAFARRKLNALQALADDSEALSRSIFARQQRIENDAANVRMRLANLDPKTESDVIGALNEELTVMTEDMGKLLRERSRRMSAKANADQILSVLQSFVTTQLGLDMAGASAAAFRTVNVTATPRDGETVADAIRRVRQQVAALNGELTAVRNAPPSADEIRTKIVQQIDDLAKAGRPQLSVDNGKVVLDFADTIRLHIPDQALSAPSGSASALLAWMFRDQLLKAALAGVDDIAGDMNAEQRKARIAELEAELLRLEHEEEAFVCSALDQGLECHRRPNASGWALLGIEIDHSVAAESLQAAE